MSEAYSVVLETVWRIIVTTGLLCLIGVVGWLVKRLLGIKIGDE